MPDVPAMLSARFTEYEPKDGIPGGGIKLKTDRDYHDTNYGLGGTNIGFEVVPGGGYIMEGSDRVECNGFKGTSDTLKVEAPEGKTEGEKRWLVESFGGRVGCWYEYIWLSGKAPEESSREESSEAETTTKRKGNGKLRVSGLILNGQGRRMSFVQVEASLVHMTEEQEKGAACRRIGRSARHRHAGDSRGFHRTLWDGQFHAAPDSESAPGTAKACITRPENSDPEECSADSDDAQTDRGQILHRMRCTAEGGRKILHRVRQAVQLIHSSLIAYKQSHDFQKRRSWLCHCEL